MEMKGGVWRFPSFFVVPSLSFPFSHFLFGFGFCGLPFGVGSDCDSTISYLRSSSFTLGRHQSYEAVCICAVRAAAHKGNPVWSFSTVSGPFSAKIWLPSVGRCSCRDSSSDMARSVALPFFIRDRGRKEEVGLITLKRSVYLIEWLSWRLSPLLLCSGFSFFF